MRLGGLRDLTQRDGGRGYRGPRAGIDGQVLRHRREVHQDALTNVPAAHRAAGATEYERLSLASRLPPTVRGPLQQVDQVRLVGRNRHARGQHPVHARAFAVGGTGAEVGAEGTA